MLRWGAFLWAAAAAAGALAQDVPSQTAPAAPAAAKSKQYDVSVFAELPMIDAPQLSPDGRQLAAKVAVDGRQYFALVPLVEGLGKQKLVGLGDNDLNWWRWVNNDWLVMGIGRTIKYEAMDWYVSRAVGVNARNAGLVPLSGRDAAQDADDLVWIANDGTPRVLLASQTSIYFNTPGFWPKVDEVDVSTGKHRRVLASREGVLNWFADQAGTVRMGVGASVDGRSRRVLYRPDGKADFRVIDRARGPRDSLTVPALFLDAPNQALVIEDDAGGFSTLYEYDLATMQRGKQIFASKGYDIEGIVTDGTGGGYLGVSVNEDRPGVRWLDPGMEAMQKTIAGMIKGGEPEIVSLSRDRSAAVVKIGGPSAPGAYYLYRADGSMTRLAINNTTLGMKRLHRVETIRYKARDGLEIAAVLTLPRGETRNMPLIVMPHGGPFARDSEEWDWWAQFLADRGYVVVQPNYRGSSGYGTIFAAKGEGQWGLAMQDDLNDAVAELAKRGIADPKRVCMVGASYGGYAALRAAQRDGKLYRCAVSYAGVSDLGRMTRYDRNFLGSGRRKDWLRAQAPDFKAVTPLSHASEFSIPVLIVHGKKDRVVPVNQSRVMAEQLREAGKDVTYIEQPEADHHFTRSQDRLEFLKALEAFLAKHNPA